MTPPSQKQFRLRKSVQWVLALSLGASTWLALSLMTAAIPPDQRATYSTPAAARQPGSTCTEQVGQEVKAQDGTVQRTETKHTAGSCELEPSLGLWPIAIKLAIHLL